ncbi:ras GTPase-activating protein [Lentinula aciculospora]|uniref:Ras GTPase-activating protein n=1 Tax=Lentinula aciculospora TaxID=153920 RepID=A0A9W9AA70_9AGAR|nr:ras GTPase-activating protein [Lentinula aciculospora]
MQRSGSSSDSSNPSSSRPGGPFAYQTRLLERTSSSSNGSLSRTNSQSGNNILTNNTGSSVSSATRRWTPGHRVANSLDAVRGKWEERARENTIDESPSIPHTPTRLTSFAKLQNAVDSSSVPSPSSPLERTPTYLKRFTTSSVPSPIIATPLSPNSTGVTVEADPPSPTLARQRIHLPSHVSRSAGVIRPISPPSLPQETSPPRRNTVDFSSFKRINPSRNDSTTSIPSTPSTSSSFDPSSSIISTPTSVHRRPTSLYSRPSVSSDRDKLHYQSTGSTSPYPRSSPTSATSVTAPSPSSPSSNAMFPTTYRSSYMQNKSKYGSTLSAGGRRFGKHLPRIASGDNEDPIEEKKKQKEIVKEPPPRRVEKRAMRRDGNFDTTPRRSQTLEASNPDLADSDAVVGIPGRMRLSRNKAPNTPVPLPSARLTRGLWADTQRHLIQAYEYLCHVGEAQQWIEGCLDQELGFGVVEMEEGLRNGVVLAKLVRVFQGEGVVRRIYEAPKLDFRHSDNINYFFLFVRHVGLPECFIFELTDLYEKKNLPKVIYCIHALSHLLARRGLAERIGNLLGQLQFSDDQLQATQKGLTASGVAMPNFGNVGRELAKEINEEPEVEVETEDERRDRLLLENEGSIIALQSVARGYLARQAQTVLYSHLQLSGANVVKVQARCRAVMTRRRISQQRKAQNDLRPWAVTLQARIRGALARKRWQSHLSQIAESSRSVVKLQARLRGVLLRRRYNRLQGALRSSKRVFVNLQSIARAKLTRQTHNELVRTFSHPQVLFSIAAFQAQGRGVLSRRKFAQRAALMYRLSPCYIALQAHCRGVLIRRQMRKQMAKLEDVSQTVVRIQAAVRTYLARKRLLLLIRGLRKATPLVVGFQARARAALARQKHENLSKALSEVKTIKAVSGMQSLARAALARNRHREINRKLDFVAPDMVGLQAAVRGALARDLYYRWREHLHNNEHVATVLQAMLRGLAQRKKFHAKMEYYRANLSKVVKIQSLFRAKETREQYRQLTMGKNVTVGTIKNFVHLLDDSETDFQEELKVERLRKKVVESIRENQALESDVTDLDVKIALVVQNVKSFEDVIKARRGHGPDSAAAHAARTNLLAAHGDPFSGPNTLDQTARRKLELYQQLFYHLQTHSEYLSRLFVRLSKDDAPEKDRRFAEGAVLTLYGFGQDRREDYLLLKLFQAISAAYSIQDIIDGHPMYINIAVHYVRPKQIAYARDTFQTLIRQIVEDDDLDFEVDPTIVHRARIELEEMRAGRPSSQPKDVSFRQALDDPATRPIFIRHLQALQLWTDRFVAAIIQSTKKMPFSMRYLARETLACVRERFPDAPEEAYAACVGRLVYYRYINPAIVTPETFDIVSKTIDISSRKNLAQISRVMTQITSGVVFDDHSPNMMPINEFVSRAVSQISSWMLEVADVPDAEITFHAHEFLDATVPPKPIYISPNEIYAMHALIVQHLSDVAPAPDDAIRAILTELNGVPNFGNEELKDARDRTITLELTNRFANVEDPLAEEKTLWVQAKRGVLAILRVQPTQDLLGALLRPVTEEDESVWEDILDVEIANEARQIPRRQASAIGADAAYRLEDIRLLNFAAVKALAIQHLLKLESLGKVTRGDGFQGILNAIAGDVRSKHRKRIQRQQETESMNEALEHLAERKKYFQEQIDSYHNYVDAAMNTMQRGKSGKRRFVLPFTKQYFHLRDLQKSGQSPQFGSFLYTAKYLYDKGILLSIDQYSPRQFDRLNVTMSSKTAGIFTITLESSAFGVSSRVASEDVRMEELLQAKYEQRSFISLFDDRAKFNFELFLYQINKKYVRVSQPGDTN